MADNLPFVDEMTMHAGARQLYQFIKQSSLGMAPKTQECFANLAQCIAATGDSPEVTVALRKLLECKDAAARAGR